MAIDLALITVFVSQIPEILGNCTGLPSLILRALPLSRTEQEITNGKTQLLV